MKKLNKPCHVVQLFNNSYEYDKLYKDYNSRKDLVAWKEQLPSQTQFIDKLYISQQAYQYRQGVLGNFLLLLDHNCCTYEDFLNLQQLDAADAEDTMTNRINYQAHQLSQQGILQGTLTRKGANLGIFKFKLAEDKNQLEVYLNWSYWKLGEPFRENYQVAVLKPNEPIQIKLDGKRDFSMSSRRKRTFMEHDYILEYKGLVSAWEIMEETVVFEKPIPEPKKEINLMKYLK